MEWLRNLFQLVLHVDQTLQTWVLSHGGWVYGLLFVVVFCETGLVVAPFLPGDSLLFAVGALCARGDLSWWTAAALLLSAAVLGDAFNYQVGVWVARGSQRSVWLLRWIKPSHLARARVFLQQHGAKAVVLGRWAPLLRTIVPFVAGVGRMPLRTFVVCNVLGAVAWVGARLGLGYLFGRTPVVQRSFSWIVAGIVVVSFVPAAIAWWRSRRNKQEKGS